MIGYLDTSALVPLIVQEPSSEMCMRFWDDADVIASSRLLYVETAAALAQAERMDRITTSQQRKGVKILDSLWDEMEIIEIDEGLSKEAADFARAYALRGYDAIHCASAYAINENEFVAASGDAKLLDAWSLLGISTFDINPDH